MSHQECTVSLSIMSYSLARHTPLSMEFSRQEYWNELPFSPPGDIPALEIKPLLPAGTGGFFTTEPQGMLLPITLSQCSFFYSP